MDGTLCSGRDVKLDPTPTPSSPTPHPSTPLPMTMLRGWVGGWVDVQLRGRIRSYLQESPRNLTWANWIRKDGSASTRNRVTSTGIVSPNKFARPQ